jgi:DNA-binding PadR family transcriptional regulator
LSIHQQQEEKAQQLVDTWFHRYRRGSLRFFILHLLLHKHGENKSERQLFHGYKLVKAIHDETHGEWTPKTASIYPILKELAKEDVIEQSSESSALSDESARSIKQYCLTPFGIIVAKKLEEKRKEMAKNFISKHGETPRLPPPMFRLPRKELLKVLEESEMEHLVDFQNHLLKIQKHNNEILDIIDNLLKEKKTDSTL